MNILYAVLALGLMGLAFGLLLAYASKIFYVKTDERLPLILESLPGANCGGCGFPGCGGLASAIISGAAPVNGCPVGGSESANKIAEIMGVEAAVGDRMVAHVHCNGGDFAEKKFAYEGIEDCLGAMKVAGGPMVCRFACIGLGTCVKACPFNAIHIVDGSALVDEAKCTACAKCVASCPKKLIAIKSENNTVTVTCSSHEKGVTTRNSCSQGCIGCKLCEKKCQHDAIHVVDNLAIIDYDKCISCGDCVSVCPRKIIENTAPHAHVGESTPSVHEIKE